MERVFKGEITNGAGPPALVGRQLSMRRMGVDSTKTQSLAEVSGKKSQGLNTSKSAGSMPSRLPTATVPFREETNADSQVAIFQPPVRARRRQRHRFARFRRSRLYRWFLLPIFSLPIFVPLSLEAECCQENYVLHAPHWYRCHYLPSMARAGSVSGPECGRYRDRFTRHCGP